MRSYAAALCLAASVLAIQITGPIAGSAYGPNTVIPLTWTSVSSDPSTFQVILIDPTQKITRVLDSTVQTSLGSLALSPPAGGWPLGVNWTINAMGNSPGQSGILAQSGTVDITPSGVSPSGTVVTTGSLPTTMSIMQTATIPSTTATVTVADGSGTSGTSIEPTSLTGGASANHMSGLLLGLVAGITAFLF